MSTTAVNNNQPPAAPVTQAATTVQQPASTTTPANNGTSTIQSAAPAAPATGGIFSTLSGFAQTVFKPVVWLFNCITWPFQAIWNALFGAAKDTTWGNADVRKQDSATLTKLADAIAKKDQAEISKEFAALSKTATALLTTLKFDEKNADVALAKAAQKNIEIMDQLANPDLFKGVDYTKPALQSFLDGFAKLPQDVQNAFKFAIWKLLDPQDAAKDPAFGDKKLASEKMSFVADLFKAANASLQVSTDLNKWCEHMPKDWQKSL